MRLLKDTEVKCLTFEPHDLLICTWLCFVFIYAQNPRNKSRWNERIWVWWLLQKKRVRYIQCCFAQFGKWPFSFFFHLPAISQYSYACSSSTPAKRWQNFHHTHPSIHYTLIHKITYPHKRQQEHVASETCVPNFSRLTRNLQEVLILFLTGHIIWACISFSISTIFSRIPIC